MAYGYPAFPDKAVMKYPMNFILRFLAQPVEPMVKKLISVFLVSPNIMVKKSLVGKNIIKGRFLILEMLLI